MRPYIFIVVFLMSTLLKAVVPDDMRSKATLYGVVIDSLSKNPVEFATVALFHHDSRKLVDGLITDVTGSFRFKGLEFGTYDLQITFIGYSDFYRSRIQTSSDQSAVDLGKIKLQRSSLNLDEVEIVDGTPAVEYKIDRKVIHVDKQITAISGTAIDILQSVPSVSVDLEGNITLRGSSGFTVLIDGKPSVLDPSDILTQIPASSIADIEIITNPSAKYDPDGTAGIINIKMKKLKLEGFNGVFNANLGQFDAYGGDFLLNYKKKNYNVYLGGDYNNRRNPGYMTRERTTFSDDTTFFSNSSGDRERSRLNKNLRMGIELNLTELDFANFGITLGSRGHNSHAVSNYDEWTIPGGNHNLYTSIEDGERGGNYYTLNFDFRHQFGHPEHELALQVIYDGRYGDESSVNELTDTTGTIVSGQRSTETGPMKRVRIKADYTRPILENNKLEAGFQSLLARSKDINTVENYNLSSHQYDLIPEYGHTSLYNDDVYALYATFSGEAGKFGYMVGLRGEYTNRKMELEGENTTYTLDRFDYFPSVHLSYQLPKDHQLMVSYARRIERPRGYFLEPFITVQDAYNVRQGNPELLPEYIDSYDLGYQKKFRKNFISLDAYYRIVRNKIQRVSSVYDKNIMLSTFENVGTDYSLGIEAMLSLDLIKWWKLELMGNVFDYRIEGTLYDEPFKQTSVDWSSRVNNTFMVGDFTKIQVKGNYNSPSVFAQGTREGYYVLNMAASRDFFRKKLTVVLQANDLLSTARYETTLETPDLQQYLLFERKSPYFMVTLTYKLNNYKMQKSGRESGESSSFEGEGEM